MTRRLGSNCPSAPGVDESLPSVGTIGQDVGLGTYICDTLLNSSEDLDRVGQELIREL